MLVQRSTILLLMLSLVREVFLFDCPSLSSLSTTSGTLLFDKSFLEKEDRIVHCQWLIASPPTQQLVIEFDYISIPISGKEYLHAGCRRASLNLWNAGSKHEKIELCGDRYNVRVGGITQVLIIELLINDPRLNVQFFMKYQLVPIIYFSTTTTTHSTPLTAQLHQVYSSCGLTSIDETRYSYGVDSRIVGGRQVIPHTHPWQVLLNNRGRFCGATVLNTRWLITAAHCVNGTDPKKIIVEFGIHDRSRIENSREARTIKQIVVYPLYSGRSSKWIHDIALLKISAPLIYNAYIRPVCLPPLGDTIKTGDRTFVTGWGSTLKTGISRYLQEVEVTIQSNEQCGLKDIRWKTNICAGLCMNSTCDACQGDSGGPMVQYRKNRWQLVGLISWGFSCAGLGVYTKISYYSEWIRNIIEYF